MDSVWEISPNYIHTFKPDVNLPASGSEDEVIVIRNLADKDVNVFGAANNHILKPNEEYRFTRHEGEWKGFKV